MARGGSRAGAGRPRNNPDSLVITTGFSLSRELLDWLDAQPDRRSSVVVDALIRERRRRSRLQRHRLRPEVQS